MRFVEVACVVIQGSPPSLAHVPLSAQSLTRRRVTPTPVTCRRSARLLPIPLRLSTAPGNPFWPRGHLFHASSGREYKTHRLF